MTRAEARHDRASGATPPPESAARAAGSPQPWGYETLKEPFITLACGSHTKR